MYRQYIASLKTNSTHTMKAQKWIFAKHFDGFPKDSDLRLEEEEISEDLQDGEFIIEAVYLSVDPYMRPYSARLPEGIVMIGQQLARVIKSAHKDYPEDTLVLSPAGWRTMMKINCNEPAPAGSYHPIKVPPMGNLPISLALGAMGMPGATAYFGLLKICNPQPGETVLVNGAAGAVGSLVGQIAKIKGCKVIGYAGTDAKCAWLKEIGFDFAFNYKTQDLDKTLKEAAPGGIDCYFDNVGGEFTFKVIQNHMNTEGRISVCGSIDQYNDTPDQTKQGPYPWSIFVFKQLKMEGFLAPKFIQSAEHPTFLKEMGQWIAEGKIQYKEHITEGFENMPQAFFGLLRGENTGKAVVRSKLDVVLNGMTKLSTD